MQELVLVQPGSAADREWAKEAASAATRREFEDRLAECGPLAYRVARGVLRNDADAEDVAQEALIRAYRRFDRLRDRDRFRGWLVRISFRLALDRVRSGKRREQRETLWSRTSPHATTEDLAASSEFQSASRSRPGRAFAEVAPGPASCGHGRPHHGRSRRDAGDSRRNGEIKIVVRQKTVSGEVAMSCEQYKEALIDAAASGDTLPLDLRSHLDGCVSCLAAFEEERRLLAAIDSGVRAAVNGPVPLSLIPAVHLREAQEDASNAKRSPSTWIYLAAAAALILVLFPLLRPRNVQPFAQSRTEATTSSASIGIGLQAGEPSAKHGLAKNAQPQPASAIGQRANSKSPTPTRTVLAFDVRPPRPEVLVPPDERIALTKYLSRREASGAEPKSLAVAVANSSSEPQVEPLTIEPLQIAQLELKSLEEQLRQADDQTRTR